METDFKQLGQLDEIADITCSLTYGEMIDLAAELWKAAGGAEITAKTLHLKGAYLAEPPDGNPSPMVKRTLT